MSLHLDLAPGDTLLIGDGTRIRLEKKTGQRARLVIDSPDDVSRVKAGVPIPATAPLARQRPPIKEGAKDESRPFLTRHTQSA
jgi:hypothetical protein